MCIIPDNFYWKTVSFQREIKGSESDHFKHKRRAQKLTHLFYPKAIFFRFWIFFLKWTVVLSARIIIFATDGLGGKK